MRWSTQQSSVIILKTVEFFNDKDWNVILRSIDCVKNCKWWHPNDLTSTWQLLEDYQKSGWQFLDNCSYWLSSKLQTKKDLGQNLRTLAWVLQPTCTQTETSQRRRSYVWATEISTLTPTNEFVIQTVDCQAKITLLGFQIFLRPNYPRFLKNTLGTYAYICYYIFIWFNLRIKNYVHTIQKLDSR